MSGTVEMDARIGVDGLTKDVHLTAPAAQDFADAMAAAIRGWQFSTTLLDCVPVEVSMHVSGNFIAQ